MSESAGNGRKATRVRTILSARVVLGKGFADVSCQVKDLSDTGARIVVDEAAVLPTRFALSIPKNDVTHVCELRWRSGKSAGVEFVEDGRAPDALEPSAYIRQLETENARLRTRLAEMAKRLYDYGDSNFSEP